MSKCLLCDIDESATDEQTYRALYFIAGANSPEDRSYCERHMRTQAFALSTLARLTGFAEFSKPLEEAVRATKLQLVRSPRR